MTDLLPIGISAAALIVSGITAWLTIIRRGTVKMTQPTVLYFGPDSPSRGSSSPKVFLRTLLYSTSRQGRIVENMYVKVHRGETSQSFSIWVYGNEGLQRGSGLFVGHEGVAFNHHFLLPEDGTSFEFLPGRYEVEVFATLVGNSRKVRLGSVRLTLGEKGADALKGPSKGVYFDLGPGLNEYHFHIREAKAQPRPEDFLALLPRGLQEVLGTEDDQTTEMAEPAEGLRGVGEPGAEADG